MCKPIGTDNGKKHWVQLSKLKEIITAIQLGLNVGQHPKLGPVVICNDWKQAKNLAGQIRRAPAPVIG